MGKSSLVEMTSREFHPMMETPLNTEESTTTTSSVFCWSGMIHISRELTPDTIRDNTEGERERAEEFVSEAMASCRIISALFYKGHTWFWPIYILTKRTPLHCTCYDIPEMFNC